MDNIFAQHAASMPWLKDKTLFLARHGSHAYGLNTPTSDEDFKGFCTAPPEYYTGFTKKFEQAETKEPDSVIYEVRKFFSLAADCNPSIIEVLWTDESDWMISSNWSDAIVLNREAFLSKKAKHTFSGYAISQLKRIQRHREWLIHPPQKEPVRKDFGLPEHTVIPTDQRKMIEAAITAKLAEWDGLLDWDGLDPASCIAIRGKMAQYLTELSAGTDPEAHAWLAAANTLALPKDTIHLLFQERNYNNARREWQQYQNWKATRNPARAELEAKYGYDTKHGMHLVRLMRMGYEILTTKKVLVKRPDREELLSIRAGAWDYDTLINYTTKMEANLEEAYATSKLPSKPDRDYLDRLCQSAVLGGIRLNLLA